MEQFMDRFGPLTDRNQRDEFAEQADNMRVARDMQVARELPWEPLGQQREQMAAEQADNELLRESHSPRVADQQAPTAAEVATMWRGQARAERDQQAPTPAELATMWRGQARAERDQQAPTDAETAPAHLASADNTPALDTQEGQSPRVADQQAPTAAELPRQAAEAPASRHPPSAPRGPTHGN